jgi:hypothetical protein
MHGSELPPLAAPPISITCDACRSQMRLASIDPTGEKAVYTYECANGHQRNIYTADPTSVRGTPTVRPIAGPAPPEPRGNLQRRAEHFPAAVNCGSKGLARNLSAACVAARVVNDRFGGFWKSGTAWGQAPRRRTSGWSAIVA